MIRRLEDALRKLLNERAEARSQQRVDMPLIPVTGATVYPVTGSTPPVTIEKVHDWGIVFRTQDGRTYTRSRRGFCKNYRHIH